MDLKYITLEGPRWDVDFLNHRVKKNLLVYSESHFTKTNSRREKSFRLKRVFGKITMISVAASSQLISEVCLCPRFSGEETGELDIHR